MPIQPLHPSVISKLDPEYVEFHNKHLQYLPIYHTVPWNPEFRNGVTVPGSTPPLEVGKIQDYDLTHTNFRTFTPPGEAPAKGWPLFIFFHGGGWTMGKKESESSFATQMCIHAKCVVISVNYRLAPEYPYPAAVEDAIESLQWVVKNGKGTLNIDLSRVAVGGSSSGGNLAAALALKAPFLTPPLPHPLVLQLLIVPVTDNTSTDLSPSQHASWKTNEHTPWLSPARMLWFQNNYLPDVNRRSEWLASPLLAPDDVIKGAPKKCWVGVTEMDVLRDEGLAFASRLEKAGVDTQVVVYERAPHPIMAMDGVLAIGKKMVKDAGEALKAALYDCKLS
ncbi:Alpha/Beta hydrolase protein [Amanita rubescens]|nr:Alpha/Beta hydrolase protein [Amanita rubescens]